MQYVNGIRKAAPAIAALLAALSVTACQAGGSKAGAESSSNAPSSSPSASTTPGTKAPEASDAPTSKAPTATASPISGSGSTGTTAKTCAATALEAAAYQATDRPDGTGTGAAIIEFTNTSGAPCLLQGHPTVAGAGNGSPQHNAPLKVTPTGSATPVKVAPGGKAWLKLTFVQVQGEADGYCESGSKPVSYPTLVVALPGSGAHQVALNDGVFAECDNTVTATAVSAAKLS
ncbi:DUF4232 domain-containing protein [Streptomyces sp. NPDC047043]|uniref:DUF4232 domain-containing protein n=1 Tax=Streptomyces sp. NPDC047043 TaxID=3154497 RepID=UPI0033E2065B